MSGHTEKQAARLLDRIDGDKAKAHEALRRMFEHVTDHNADRLTYLDGQIDHAAMELRAIVVRRTR